MKALVLGGGSIGTRHLQNLKSLGVEQRAVVEPDVQQRGRALGQDEDVSGFARLEQGLEWGPDFVVIATPSHLHVGPALAAARRGCHLFIEKPLSHSMKDVETLQSEVVRRSLITMVACNMRFHPGPARVKTLLEEAVIGQVIAARLQGGSYLPRWRPGQDYQQSYSASPDWGGIIFDGIHEIDLALWYLGPARVVGAAHVPASTIGLTTDGLAEILLCHEPGVLSNVHLNFVQRDYRRTCQIIGSEGTIYWDFMERQIRIYGADGEMTQSYPEPAGWQVNQMYVDELSHFIDCVQRRRATINPLSGGVAALRIALDARTRGALFS